MEDNFYGEFNETSLAEWQEKIIKDLKGKTPEEVSKTTQDGITIQPHYHRENVKHNNGIPAVSPYLRGLKRETGAAEIVEIIEGSDSKKLNAIILKALNSGATALQINVDRPDLKTLLNDVDLRYISTWFNGNSPEQTINEFENVVKEKQLNPQEIKGSYCFDPLGNSLLTGKKQNSRQVIELLAEHHQNLPRFGFIAVNAKHYHNAGGSQAQEIAFALSQAHQYLVDACEAGVPLDEFTARIIFKTACGTEYLSEIAKLRALRSLWAYIVDRYKPEFECSSATKIYFETSYRFAAVADEYNNLVRNTVQCMAGMVGGADALAVLPFNQPYAQPTPFTRRMARNISLMMQEESFLDKVIDPAGGSYAIDHLTDELSQKAWTLFQEVESKGGFNACVENNFIQNAVLTNKKRQDEEFAEGKRVMVGVNKFVNTEENLKEKQAQLKESQKPTHTDFTPLPLERIAEKTEKNLQK